MGNYSYYKQQRYKSIDGGVTWEAEDVFQKGAMIEPQNPYMCNPLDRWVEDGWMCDDCPPIPTNYKWLATYATRMSFAECDGTSAITSGEVATTDLVSVSIGDCVTTIGTLAFLRCHTLTSVTIPDSVTSIGAHAFEDCYSLTSCTIGSGVTSIGDYAFTDCESLSSVTLPNIVASIGDGAFQYCFSLSSVTIPDSVTEIGSHAFAFCIGLSSCTIGTSVTSIGEYALLNCSGLTSVNIPSGVTSIGSGALLHCSGLTSITVEAITPPTLGAGAFDDTNYPIYVPCDSLAAYQSAWSRYASRIQCIPTPSYSGQYLTFVATESGTFKFSGNSIDYSLDSGNTWATLESDTDSPTVTSGSKIMWKATLTPQQSLPFGIGTFSSIANFVAEGNPLSLLYGDNFIGVADLTGNDYAFYKLFNGCTTLTSAENLSLPATTLADYCYKNMFYGCSSLTTAPELPATTLANSCYMSMFDGCTSLTTALELPATTLTAQCYRFMFQHCSGLTVAPELPATTLADRCYELMFNLCPNINYIKCLATDISATRCTANWVRGVAASGTFVTPSSTNWSNGMSGIPNGWTRVNAKYMPTPSVYKWKATYTGGTVTSADCDATSAITSGEITLEDLVDVKIGDCVTTIGTAAFSECHSLTSVTIPNSVTSIGDYALLHCSGLTSITVEAITPPALGSYAFINTNNCPIYVPAQSVSAYQTAWSDYSSRIQAIQ